MRQFTGGAYHKLPEISVMRESISPDFSLEHRVWTNQLMQSFLTGSKNFVMTCSTAQPATLTPLRPLKLFIS